MNNIAKVGKVKSTLARELRKQPVVFGSTAPKLYSTSPTQEWSLKIYSPDSEETLIQNSEFNSSNKKEDTKSSSPHLCNENDYTNSTSPPPLPPKPTLNIETKSQSTSTSVLPLVVTSIVITSLAAATRIKEDLFGACSKCIGITSTIGATFLWTIVIGASLSSPSNK